MKTFITAILLMFLLGCASTPKLVVKPLEEMTHDGCNIEPVMKFVDVAIDDITYKFTTGESLGGWRIFKITGMDAWKYYKTCLSDWEKGGKCNPLIFWEYKWIIILELET